MAPVHLLNGTERRPRQYPALAPSRRLRVVAVAGTLLFGAAAAALWLTGCPRGSSASCRPRRTGASPQPGALPLGVPITIGAHPPETATVGYYALSSLGSRGSAE